MLEAVRAVDLSPKDTGYRANLGSACYHLKRYDDAIREFREALRLDPNNAGARDGLGEALKAKATAGAGA